MPQVQYWDGGEQQCSSAGVVLGAGRVGNTGG